MLDKDQLDEVKGLFRRSVERYCGMVGEHPSVYRLCKNHMVQLIQTGLELKRGVSMIQPGDSKELCLICSYEDGIKGV